MKGTIRWQTDPDWPHALPELEIDPSLERVWSSWTCRTTPAKTGLFCPCAFS